MSSLKNKAEKLLQFWERKIIVKVVKIVEFCQFQSFFISIFVYFYLLTLSFFRYKERLENVQSRAFESTVQRYSTDEAASSSSMPPILQPYLPRKKCEICKVIIHNEVQLQSHLRDRKHKDQVSVANDGRKLSGYVLNTSHYIFTIMNHQRISTF